jgi:hypothetical protein
MIYRDNLNKKFHENVPLNNIGVIYWQTGNVKQTANFDLVLVLMNSENILTNCWFNKG